MAALGPSNNPPPPPCFYLSNRVFLVFLFCSDPKRLQMAEEASTSALQQFCLLAKSAKGPACASLISQALEHPSVFVFGELLDMPNVQEVRVWRVSSTAPSPSHHPLPPSSAVLLPAHLHSHHGRHLSSTPARDLPAADSRSVSLECSTLAHSPDPTRLSLARSLPLPLMQLAGTSSEPNLTLLKLFAYGTWKEYKEHASSLPELSAAQATKLKKLSIVSLSSNCKVHTHTCLGRHGCTVQCACKCACTCACTCACEA